MLAFACPTSSSSRLEDAIAIRFFFFMKRARTSLMYLLLSPNQKTQIWPGLCSCKPNFSDLGLNSNLLVTLLFRNLWEAVKRLDEWEYILADLLLFIVKETKILLKFLSLCSNYQPRPLRRSAYSISLFSSTHIQYSLGIFIHTRYFPSPLLSYNIHSHIHSTHGSRTY